MPGHGEKIPGKNISDTSNAGDIFTGKKHVINSINDVLTTTTSLNEREKNEVIFSSISKKIIDIIEKYGGFYKNKDGDKCELSYSGIVEVYDDGKSEGDIKDGDKCELSYSGIVEVYDDGKSEGDIKDGDKCDLSYSGIDNKINIISFWNDTTKKRIRLKYEDGNFKINGDFTFEGSNIILNNETSEIKSQSISSKDVEKYVIPFFESQILTKQQYEEDPNCDKKLNHRKRNLREEYQQFVSNVIDFSKKLEEEEKGSRREFNTFRKGDFGNSDKDMVNRFGDKAKSILEKSGITLDKGCEIKRILMHEIGKEKGISIWISNGNTTDVYEIRPDKKLFQLQQGIDYSKFKNK